MSREPSPLDKFEMGLGTWQWGDQWLWGYGGAYAEAEVRGAFEASLAAGITLLDTAEVYGLGKSETLLGKFRRTTNTPLFIATKCMPYPWRLTPSRLLHALQRSLKRLGIEQVDVYQMHWPVGPIAIEAWMGAMSTAVEEGLTAAVGVSNYNLAQTQRAMATLGQRGMRLASNQVEYSLLQRRIEHNGVLDYCRQQGIRIMAYSPLAKGLLTGKYTPDHLPPGLRGRVGRAYLKKIQPLLATLRLIGEGYGKSPAQVALNWTICQGTLPIPGAKNAQQAEHNAGALGWRLTAAEMNMLDEASARLA